LNVHYHTLLQNPLLTGASVALNSEVRMPAMLLLIIGH